MSDAPPARSRAGIMDPLGRRGPLFLLVLFAAFVGPAAPAMAGHDPNRTVTVYIHGFESMGADHQGVYGLDIHEPIEDSLAAMAGLPVADTPGGPLPINAATATTYYGDTAPPYYSAEDRAEIDRLTSAWGGGVPRYAYVVARYAQHVLERSGADQINFVSTSFGSLVVRWLIEKNVAGLAGSGRIARWLTIEGLLAGNWAASRSALVGYLDFVQPQPIDVDHMAYDWVNTRLHSPRTEGDSPLYAGILIGQVASTDERGNSGGLSALMHSYNEFSPNDGVQALPDARFETMTAQSRFHGLPPTLGLFHVDHLGIKHHAGAYAQAATFITARRRVTVRMTSARVTNLREPQLPLWNWTPAEVVFESWAYSPAVQARWGIGDPLSARPKEDATAPLRRFRNAGETQAMAEIVFDDMVLPEETQLRIDLRAAEVDYDPAYGVFETATTPYYDDLGSGSVVVSTLQTATYTFAAQDWSCELSVNVVEYPFAAVLDVPLSASPRILHALVSAPNPSASSVRISTSGLSQALADEPARLEIADVAGRVVRVIEGRLRSGFLWDGRDSQGLTLPAGVYLHRAVTPHGIWRGRSCRVR
ncbi:MAG: hypothetical protein ABIS67_11355 [Candidatus Eisenbacteria bacterium]